MPTVLRHKGFRFFFYSNEHLPRHIHVEKDDAVAKFSLTDVELIKSNGFSSKDLNYLRKIITRNKQVFWESWDEHFNN